MPITVAWNTIFVASLKLMLPIIPMIPHIIPHLSPVLPFTPLYSPVLDWFYVLIDGNY